MLLSALLVMDGFALGGCVTSLMMRRLVMQMTAVYESQAQWLQWLAVYNLFDHLIPYYACYGAALLVLVGVTVWMWLVSRPRDRAT
jgi:hypothetical protein